MRNTQRGRVMLMLVIVLALSAFDVVRAQCDDTSAASAITCTVTTEGELFKVTPALCEANCGPISAPAVDCDPGNLLRLCDCYPSDYCSESRDPIPVVGRYTFMKTDCIRVGFGSDIIGGNSVNNRCSCVGDFCFSCNCEDECEDLYEDPSCEQLAATIGSKSIVCRDYDGQCDKYCGVCEIIGDRPCDATIRVPYARNLGNCTNALPSGASCINTPICPGSSCVDGNGDRLVDENGDEVILTCTPSTCDNGVLSVGECEAPPTVAPTSAPSESPTPAPTESPTESPTVTSPARRLFQAAYDEPRFEDTLRRLQPTSAYDDIRFETTPASCVPVAGAPIVEGDECELVCAPEVEVKRCVLDLECGAIASDELAANRERATPIGGRCRNGVCECQIENANLGRFEDGRYGYGCGDCSIDQKIVDGACAQVPTTAARFLFNTSIFDQCDAALQAGFTSDVCKRGEFLFDEVPPIWESEIDGSCSGHGQCLEVRFEDEQCVCERGFTCPDCSMSLVFDIQLFGAQCGDYLSGAGFCRENADCFFAFDDRDTLIFEATNFPPTIGTTGVFLTSSAASNIPDIEYCEDECRFVESCDAVLWDITNSACILYANYIIDQYQPDTSLGPDAAQFAFVNNKVDPDIGGECINNRCVCQQESACSQCDGQKETLVTQPNGGPPTYTCLCANVRVEPSVDLNCVYPDTEFTFGEKIFSVNQRVSITYWAKRTDGSIFPEPFVCGSDTPNEFNSRGVMEKNGWIWNGWTGSDFDFVALPREPEMIDYDVCNGVAYLEGYCGYSNRAGADVSLQLPLAGGGMATVSYGNAAPVASAGTVTVFVNGQSLREASYGTTFTETFEFNDGDLFEIKAQDGGVIVLFPLIFDCPDAATDASPASRLLSQASSGRLLLQSSPSPTSSPTESPTGSPSSSPCTIPNPDTPFEFADTVGDCGETLADGEMCFQTPRSRCSPSSCTAGIFTSGACTRGENIIVDPGFESDPEFFLKKLEISLAEGEGALLYLEVTGIAEPDAPLCTENPQTYEYIVEKIALNGVCEVSTVGECTLFETVIIPPLSSFDLYCGYENAFDQGVLFENRGFHLMTPCYIVLFVDIACGLLFIGAFVAILIYHIRDLYFAEHDPTKHTDIFLVLGLPGKMVIVLTAGLTLPLIGLPLYWIIRAGDTNEFSRTFRVAELEEDDDLYTVLVAYETETRFIRQRFWDMGIRTITWAVVGLLFGIALFAKRPVYINTTMMVCLFLVVVTNAIWLVSYHLIEDGSPYGDSWVFDDRSSYQCYGMLGVCLLGMISLNIMGNSESEERANERYKTDTLKTYQGALGENGSIVVQTHNPLHAHKNTHAFAKASSANSDESKKTVDDNKHMLASIPSSSDIVEDIVDEEDPQFGEWPITYSSEIISDGLYSTLPEKKSPEFHDLRYTACTCGRPRDYWLNGYQVRAAQAERPIEVLICVTSYNEDASEFERTLLGINRNIQHMVQTEAEDAWQKVAVVILADGRAKVNPETLRLLRVQGGYDKKQMQDTCTKIPRDFLRGFYNRRNMDEKKIDADIKDHQAQWTTENFKRKADLDIKDLQGRANIDKEKWTMAKFFLDLFDKLDEIKPAYVHAQEKMMLGRLSVENADPQTYASMHIFERSLQMVEDTNHEVFYQPMQVIFAMKERNGGKLDSHDWFFNAFTEQLQAKFCVLLDVGTIPQDRAIYKLYKAMYLDPTVGGCCGEISVHKPQLLNPIVASQHFEYKVANFMDKATESVFGFITVLPGAFSAYRYEAIRGEPLNLYFKSLTDPDSLGAFQGNMYLAEDRILCFELVARRKCAWTLRYIKNAVAETDVPETLEDLMKQRRRWLNGSTFALAFSVFNFNRIFSTGHGPIRKFFLLGQLTYYGLQLVLTWFLPGVFFLAWYLLLIEFTAEEDSLFGDFLQFMFGDLFAFMIFFQFIVAIGNKVQDQRDFYVFTRFYFGVVSFLTVVLLVQQIGESCDLFLRWSAIATSGFLFVCALMHGEMYTMTVTWLQYTSMVPVFLLAFQIYAICNTHDLSWGTKGLEAGGHAAPAASSTAAALKNAEKLERERAAAAKKEKAKEDHLKSFRFWCSLFLLGCNVLLILMVTSVQAAREGYFNALFGVLLVITSYRFIGSTVYVLQLWIIKQAHFRKKLARWVAYLPKPPYPRHLHHDGYKPRVFHNDSYNRLHTDEDRRFLKHVHTDQSLETQKFTRVVVPISLKPVLDRTSTAEDGNNLQWFFKPDNQPLLEKEDVAPFEF